MKTKLLGKGIPLAAFFCAAGSWVGFPYLGFLTGCAADASVHVPGDRFFWLILVLPPVALLCLFRALKRPGTLSGKGLAAVAFAIALCSFALMVNLYWQYHCCEVPFVEMSNNPRVS